MQLMSGNAGFTGGVLDRADQVRTNPALLAEAFADSRARLLVLDGLDPVLGEDGDLAWASLSPGRVPDDFILLGMDEAGPVFAEISPNIPHAGTFAPRVWELAQLLKSEALALYGCARSVIDWHKRHGFCANCGMPTEVVKAGWSRRCVGCEAEHFPRVDPVTIMLAEHDGRILVGRQARFPAGRYSALAGFVEPGETIEEAVARELWEEAGIRVHSVRYITSQPWPFPSSLMIACIGHTDDPTLTLDTTEIEDAKWVDAAGVRAALAGETDAPFMAPPPMAVAHTLLRHWIDGREQA
ncbi:NAD(+) diphosphatase [Rhizorhapis sp. SPR117]|uniref:NAD(+) diphosphatase n=1 Tax=Rhizorhapis sp. SPR117 TaxID=2912611 RepID=UPI001EFF6102|nr:NAD(+) diphosphatase [Rhizorhapis sp. SPR117]